MIAIYIIHIIVKKQIYEEKFSYILGIKIYNLGKLLNLNFSNPVMNLIFYILDI